MRTTMEIPHDLYHRLVARATLDGLEVAELISRYVARGLSDLVEQRHSERRSMLPVAVPPTGVPITALSRADLALIDEEV